jgi:hypothetical protein
MAVTWVQRVPVDKISEQAKEVRFWRTVATALAGLLWGLGWLTAKASRWRGWRWRGRWSRCASGGRTAAGSGRESGAG